MVVKQKAKGVMFAEGRDEEDEEDSRERRLERTCLRRDTRESADSHEIVAVVADDIDFEIDDDMAICHEPSSKADELKKPMDEEQKKLLEEGGSDAEEDKEEGAMDALSMITAIVSEVRRIGQRIRKECREELRFMSTNVQTDIRRCVEDATSKGGLTAIEEFRQRLERCEGRKLGSEMGAMTKTMTNLTAQNGVSPAGNLKKRVIMNDGMAVSIPAAAGNEPDVVMPLYMPGQTCRKVTQSANSNGNGHFHHKAVRERCRSRKSSFFNSC
eukprot:TRINITY_DN27423_c0_g1_i1.p1 TRINITY_DN27423_c0_g1~~TRINITY_DN27423_c0_g1_i1.p1  ORF type:complete len:271 (+),score=69.10 TRINITY_DN27423_c0_g1_i1:71-883(+)